MNKILIVDDDPTLVDFIKLLLESEDYEVEHAADGVKALERIAKFSPEVVLLDYRMPNMDGLDVLRHVIRDYATSSVVMVTGKGSEEVAVECMKAGAVDYVLKPFENEKLLSVIRYALENRETQLQKKKRKAEVKELIDKANDLVQQNRLEESNSLLKEAQQKLKDL